MAEEHGFQSPEGHILCANNCGFFGSPATLNLCSKCYRDNRMKEDQDAMAKAAFDSTNPHPQPSMGPMLGSGVASSSQPTVLKLFESVEVGMPSATSTKVVEVAEVIPTVSAQPNRCLTCRKRVGLTGFKCRCESMFCGSHRYPEQHGCTFDYKKAGKEAIAKANPVIKAAKLEKI